MQIVASYIGKIPADLNDEDLLKLDDSDEPIPISENDNSNLPQDEQIDGELELDFVRGSNSLLSKRCTTSILQMIEEKARTVLNKSEHSRFTFYRIEYMQGFLPVVAFVRILLELLNTHEKVSRFSPQPILCPLCLHSTQLGFVSFSGTKINNLFSCSLSNSCNVTLATPVRKHA
ncbi:Whirlin [Orchesella cincta]|uniref:Whirlin n=1 Tax=Orchesella cincta TaxID=48709 RepID=A0A1D2NHP4_ORCCI|nr:Whirlin [Orchesella cincta]